MSYVLTVATQGHSQEPLTGKSEIWYSVTLTIGGARLHWSLHNVTEEELLRLLGSIAVAVQELTEAAGGVQ
jgi:hypothetical protein